MNKTAHDYHTKAMGMMIDAEIAKKISMADYRVWIGKVIELEQLALINAEKDSGIYLVITKSIDELKKLLEATRE